MSQQDLYEQRYLEGSAQESQNETEPTSTTDSNARVQHWLLNRTTDAMAESPASDRDFPPMDTFQHRHLHQHPLNTSLPRAPRNRRAGSPLRQQSYDHLNHSQTRQLGNSINSPFGMSHLMPSPRYPMQHGSAPASPGIFGMAVAGGSSRPKRSDQMTFFYGLALLILTYTTFCCGIYVLLVARYMPKTGIKVVFIMFMLVGFRLNS